jgi:hypothetical protein
MDSQRRSSKFVQVEGSLWLCRQVMENLGKRVEAICHEKCRLVSCDGGKDGNGQFGYIWS